MDGHSDRRFFRERYDAYQILGGVADDVRRSMSFDEAALQVIARIDDALHPNPARLWFAGRAIPTIAAPASINAPRRPSQPAPGWSASRGCSTSLSRIRRAERDGSGNSCARRGRVPAARTRGMAVPVSFRETGTQAFLLLGQKRSEEPYSREDRHLLEAVTASLGLLLDRPAPAGNSPSVPRAASATTWARTAAPMTVGRSSSLHIRKPSRGAIDSTGAWARRHGRRVRGRRRRTEAAGRREGHPARLDGEPRRLRSVPEEARTAPACPIRVSSASTTSASPTTIAHTW